MNKKIGLLSAVLIITGCATSPNTQLLQIQNQLESAQEKNSQLESAISQSQADLQHMSEVNKQLQTTKSTGGSIGILNSGNDLLPPNAKTGECYARILTPEVYQSKTSEVLKKAASYRIKIIPAKYEMVEEKVLVKEASEVAELIPAKYEWKVESVLVSEGHDHLKTIPAVYETKTERILVKPAHSKWKKGRGPVEKISNSTGEIMCLIEVPAQYRTVTSRVLVAPARTEKIHHDATYKDVKKRIMTEGPRMVTRTIPAVYKTIKVRKVVQPAQEKRIEIPAVYQTVTTKEKVSDGVLEWRSILCETNTTGDVVRHLQRALLAANFNPGPIDGVVGQETMQAVKAYQKAKGLAVGQLTIETIRSLGVSY